MYCNTHLHLNATNSLCETTLNDRLSYNLMLLGMIANGRVKTRTIGKDILGFTFCKDDKRFCNLVIQVT